MELDRPRFFSNLPTLLHHISKAHFVALDLELSGIPTRLQRQYSSRKQTIAERYLELKAAAERYHILQVGLTFVERAGGDGPPYILRPYNINLTPLVDLELELERDFTYSTGAVEFLLRHEYRMDAPFAGGVPYLTKEEEVLARDRMARKLDPAQIPDIHVADDDAEVIQFMQRVREEISAWKAKPKKDYYDVKGKVLDETRPERRREYIALTRFERRLVHQLVRAEFPDLRTEGGADSVKVRFKNENVARNQKLLIDRRINTVVAHQKGFRWITEALAGGDLSGLNDQSLGTSIRHRASFVDLESLATELDQLRTALKQKKTVLVGHNCLLDLVFLHHHFYGHLPDSLDQFKISCSEKFPLIIDTKYMATDGPGGEAFRSSQLWEIAESLKTINKPECVIAAETEESDDWNTKKYHHAGFDSSVTAKVLLQLAARFSGLEKRKDTRSSVVTQKKITARQQYKKNDAEEESEATQEENRAAKKGGTKQKETAQEIQKSGFSHQNAFETLRLNSPDEEEQAGMEKPTSSSNAAKPASVAEGLDEKMKAMHIDEREDGDAEEDDIPQWQSEFWLRYCNRLRAYGTVEEVCDLNELDGTYEEEVGDEQAAEERSDEGSDCPSLLCKLGKFLQALTE